MGRVSGDLQEEGPQVCGPAWEEEAEKRESVLGPSQAGQVELLPRGGPCALWHPGLWHLLVSEVQSGDEGGAAEAVGAGAWDPGAVGGAEHV